MSLPLILSCLWVVAGAIVATQPMRRQRIVGLPLLLLAPVLILWLSVVHGAWVGVAALVAVLSMFRRPLLYLLARVRGETPELPR